MAEGLAAELGKSVLRARSAGLGAGEGEANREAVAVLEEIGIDIAGNPSRRANEKMIAAADLVIGLGVDPRDVFPELNPGKLRLWDIPDPIGGGAGAYRETRDLLRRKIVDLVIDLAAPARRGRALKK